MSDPKVLAAIEQMEGWMADPDHDLDPEQLIQWNMAFQAALAQADRTEGWPALVARAQAVGERVKARAAQLTVLQKRVKAELDSQECGNRALKGYGASTRNSA